MSSDSAAGSVIAAPRLPSAEAEFGAGRDIAWDRIGGNRRDRTSGARSAARREAARLGLGGPEKILEASPLFRAQIGGQRCDEAEGARHEIAVEALAVGRQGEEGLALILGIRLAQDEAPPLEDGDGAADLRLVHAAMRADLLR